MKIILLLHLRSTATQITVCKIILLFIYGTIQQEPTFNLTDINDNPCSNLDFCETLTKDGRMFWNNNLKTICRSL